MHHRIYPVPYTRVNEHWVHDDELNAVPNANAYCDELITHKRDEVLDLQTPWYKHIALDIVTETVFNYPYPQVTEKILRPLASKRMFILVGAPNTLGWLHNKGFKTFPKFINEDYDTIINPSKRIEFLVDEIKRICNLPMSTVKEALIEHKDIVEHNFNTIKEIETFELNALRHKLQKI